MASAPMEISGGMRNSSHIPAIPSQGRWDGIESPYRGSDLNEKTALYERSSRCAPTGIRSLVLALNGLRPSPPDDVCSSNYVRHFTIA